MKCLNMKIGDVLLFIVNFIVIYSLKLPLDKTSQTTTSVNEDIFDRKCPHISKIIRENNLTDYTINCKSLNTRNLIVNEENVLGYACLIVNNIVNFMCVNKINMTPDSLFRNNVSSICPFNFTHLEKLGFIFNNNEFLNELQSPDHCPKVCSDLYSNKTQCIVLSNFNNYLKNINSSPVEVDSTTDKIVQPPIKSEHQKVVQQNTKNIEVQNKVEYLKKDDTKNEKTVTTEVKSSSTNANNIEVVNEEKKTEKPVSSTPSKEPKPEKTPESEIKLPEDTGFISDNVDIKPKTEDLNEDDESFNEEDPSSLGETIKNDFNQIPKLSKEEVPVVEVTSSLKNKEIYTGEGFFQAEDSHFFFYFIMVSSIIVVGYLAFHNKNKILAYALEGSSGRRSRRRPNPARYRKLETNLEEVISSNSTNAASSSVVY